MREWRRIYRSLTSSDRLANVSDSAWRLYLLVLVNQDDRGAYPWTKPLVRTLIAGTSWTQEQAETFLAELKAQGLITVQGALLSIRRGAELNGPPKSGSETFQAPRLYSTSTDAVGTEEVQRTDLVGTRGEERRVREEKSKSTPSVSLKRDGIPLKGEAPRRKNPSSFLCPDWFKPLTTLNGYTQRDHSKAVAVLEAACATARISPADLARAFAAFWPEGQIAYGWRDPVAAFVKTRDVQISKAGKDGNAASVGASSEGSPESAREHPLSKYS